MIRPVKISSLVLFGWVSFHANIFAQEKVALPNSGRLYEARDSTTWATLGTQSPPAVTHDEPVLPDRSTFSMSTVSKLGPPTRVLPDEFTVDYVRAYQAITTK